MCIRDSTYTARIFLDGSGRERLLSRSRVATQAITDPSPPFVSLRTTMEHADQGDRARSMLLFHGQPRHCAWWVPTSPTTTAICVSIPWSTWCQMGQEPNRAMAWGLEKLNPHLARRMEACEGHSTVEVERTEVYHMDRFAGDGWMCVGRAHHAVHPVFSFGLSLELADARAAADATHSALNTGRDALYFSRFMAASKVQHEAIDDLIRYFWRYPSFLAHKARGETRRELVRLFAGDVREGTVSLLGSMRTSLHDAQLGRTGQPAQPRTRKPDRGRLRATPQPVSRSMGPWGRGRS